MSNLPNDFPGAIGVGTGYLGHAISTTANPNPDLPAEDFPSLRRIIVTDFVGPVASNAQDRALEKRDEYMRAILVQMQATINVLDVWFLRRDSSVQKDGQSGALGDLGMNGHKVTGTVAAVANGQAVEYSQLVAEQTARSTGDSTNASAISAEAVARANADTTLQTNINAKAPLASPALTGTPTAPSASHGDNTTKIATTAFVQDAISGFASGPWRQADLNTSLGAISGAVQSGFPFIGILPGGEYGFYPQIKGNSATPVLEGLLIDINTTTYATRIGVSTSTAGFWSTFAQQRYINASPPYDLGDGEVPIFVFVLLNKDGSVAGTYVAHDPPWAHNGPTRVSPDYYKTDVTTGKRIGFQRHIVLPGDFRSLSAQEKMAARRAAKVVDVEVGQAIKNADMGLIPHPFEPRDGQSVVLLDPVATEDLAHLHGMGEGVSALFHDGHLLVGAEVKRSGPRGVLTCAWKWR